MRLEETRDRERVLAVALDAEVERFETLEEQERVEGRQRRVEVAQEDEAEADREGRRAEGVCEREAVVRRLGVLEEGLEAGIRSPVELPPVHDRAADGRPVAADPLRGRVEDDVRSMLDRAAEERCRERVVDDKRHARVVSDLREE